MSGAKEVYPKRTVTKINHKRKCVAGPRAYRGSPLIKPKPMFKRLHQPCPDCNSSDALCLNEDGSTKCFSCGVFAPPSKQQPVSVDQHIDKEFQKKMQRKPIVAFDIKSRCLMPETTKRYSYGLTADDKQVANYYAWDQTDREVAQKIRTATKDFFWLGEKGRSFLFGQQLFLNGGHTLVVTEGEIDAMTVAQEIKDDRVCVVSLSDGAQSAKTVLEKQKSFLVKFKNVVLLFDNDEPGQKAAAECVEHFKSLNIQNVVIPEKDANEMLCQDRSEEMRQLILAAVSKLPEDILDGRNMWQLVITEPPVSPITYPWIELNKKLRGIRTGEVVVFTSGSGMGKSTICRELAYHIMLKHNRKVAYIALEESPRRTALSLMGLHLNKPLYVDDVSRMCEAVLKDAFEHTVGNGLFYALDHCGPIDTDVLLKKLEFMVTELGCSYIFLDHLTLAVSDCSDSDLVRAIDSLAGKLITSTRRNDFCLFVVSQLRKTSGVSFEEGGRVSLNSMKGSGAIGHNANIVVAMERDQQADDECDRNKAQFRILKNREGGITGVAGGIVYNPATGRLVDTESNPFFTSTTAKQTFEFDEFTRTTRV